MDEAFSVGVVERLTHILHHPDQIEHMHAALESLIQITAADVFEDQVQRTAAAADIVDLHDVRMG